MGTGYLIKYIIILIFIKLIKHYQAQIYAWIVITPA